MTARGNRLFPSVLNLTLAVKVYEQRESPGKFATPLLRRGVLCHKALHKLIV